MNLGSAKATMSAEPWRKAKCQAEESAPEPLKTAYALLALPAAFWPDVQKLWKENGYRPLPEYAPYTAYCLTVDIFFHLCIDKGLISPDRASNKTDIAYLYYLPFAMGFVSNDKLHKRVAPLFTGPEQQFIDGQALRDDMVALDDYFWSLPAEQREQGLFKLAARPPDDDRFLTTRLWRQFRVPVVPPQPRAGKDEQLHDALLRQVRELKAHAARGVPAGLKPADISDPDQLVMERAIPLRRGKWHTLPPGVR